MHDLATTTWRHVLRRVMRDSSPPAHVATPGWFGTFGPDASSGASRAPRRPGIGLWLSRAVLAGADVTEVARQAGVYRATVQTEEWT